jgi:hypothetical protein
MSLLLVELKIFLWWCHRHVRLQVRVSLNAYNHMTFTCRLFPEFSFARVDFDLMFSLHLRRLVTTPAHTLTAQGRGGALSIRVVFAHPSTSRRYPCHPFISPQQRCFVTGSTPRAPPPDSRPSSSIPPMPYASSPPIRRSVFSRLLPASLLSNADGTTSATTSFRKIVALARPERRPLLTAISLLFVSSSVGLSIPFTVGKLIDYFTSPNPVGWSSSHCDSFCLAILSCYDALLRLSSLYEPL